VDVADEDQPATGFDVQELERAIRRLEATELALIAKADRQQTRRHSGASSTSAWVAELTRSGGAAAARDVTLATTLDDELPATKAAFEAGEVSRTNAGIIADTMAGLPDTLTETERATVEAHLVRDGKHLAPGRLRRVASQALAAADKSAAEVAQHEEDGLLDQERRACARSSISMHDNGDGTTTGRFLLPTGPAHVLRKVLQSMTSPRRDHLTKDAERVISDGQKAAGDLDDGSVAAQLAAATTVGGRNADWDALSWAERQGRAFADLLEHLPTDRLTGKVASTVVVTMTLEQVQGAARAAETATVAGLDSSSVKPSVGAAQTDSGHRHSTSEARRLACGAGILPAVLRGESVPLDLGRQERFFTEAQRTALSTCYTNVRLRAVTGPMPGPSFTMRIRGAEGDTPTSTSPYRSADSTTAGSMTRPTSTPCSATGKGSRASVSGCGRRAAPAGFTQDARRRAQKPRRCNCFGSRCQSLATLTCRSRWTR
jgi:hypothetical protein